MKIQLGRLYHSKKSEPITVNTSQDLLSRSDRFKRNDCDVYYYTTGQTVRAGDDCYIWVAGPKNDGSLRKTWEFMTYNIEMPFEYPQLLQPNKEKIIMILHRCSSPLNTSSFFYKVLIDGRLGIAFLETKQENIIN